MTERSVENVKLTIRVGAAILVIGCIAGAAFGAGMWWVGEVDKEARLSKLEGELFDTLGNRWRSYEMSFKSDEDNKRFNDLFARHFPEQYARMTKDPATGEVDFFIRPRDVKEFFRQLESRSN